MKRPYFLWYICASLALAESKFAYVRQLTHKHYFWTWKSSVCFLSFCLTFSRECGPYSKIYSGCLFPGFKREQSQKLVDIRTHISSSCIFWHILKWVQWAKICMMTWFKYSLFITCKAIQFGRSPPSLLLAQNWFALARREPPCKLEF